MSKFNIGDKVMIVRAFSDKDHNTCVTFNDIMEKQIGKSGVITSVSEYKGFFGVKVDTDKSLENFTIDDWGWNWHESSLQLLTVPKENPFPQLKTGNRVIFRNGKEAVYVRDLNKYFILDIDGGFIHDQNIKPDGVYECEVSNWDVMEIFEGDTYSGFLVRGSEHRGDCIWECQEKISEREKKFERIKELNETIEKAQHELSVLSASLNND